MSGLEIVGLVAGIVSAYAGAGTLYRDWRRGRKARTSELRNQNLLELVETSGGKVQDQYDADFRRLGHVFASGDEIGRTALMAELIELQQHVIAVLTKGGGGLSKWTATIHPHHYTIERAAERVRQNAIYALIQQYQRLRQAAPVARTISPPPSSTVSRTTGPLIGLKMRWLPDRLYTSWKTITVDVSPTATFGDLIEQAARENNMRMDKESSEWRIPSKTFYGSDTFIRKAKCWNDTLESLGIVDGDVLDPMDGHGFFHNLYWAE